MKKTQLLGLIFALIFASVIFLAFKMEPKTKTITSIDTDNNKKEITVSVSENQQTEEIDKDLEIKTDQENTKREETTISKDSSENKKEEGKKKEGETEVETELVSWGHSSARSAKIDTIIIHSVYNKTGGDQYSLSKILDIFKDYNVAPHYIIERSGAVHQLVKEGNTAWHAGTSEMPDGRENVNNFSIGIEVINSESDKPEGEQYQSLENLIDEIKDRQKIKHVLGHSDIAEGRKTDPWNFDWEKVGGKEK